MSVSESAHVVVLLADYINVDAAGKVNALGAGFLISPLQPSGLTAPQHLAVLVDVPSRHAGQEFALSVELRDDTLDTAVQVPGPTGKMEALRVQQLVRGDRPSIPGLYLPDTMPVRVQLTLGFVQGLPLAPGKFYSWRAEVDGQHRQAWRARFHVPGPPPPPVFGGVTGPADVPTIPAPDELD